MKKHALDGGIEVMTYDLPPPGFDPLTASQRNLDLHGFRRGRPTRITSVDTSACSAS